MKQLEPDLSRHRPWGIQVSMSGTTPAITWRFHDRGEAEQIAAFYRRIMPSSTFQVLFLEQPPIEKAPQ